MTLSQAIGIVRSIRATLSWATGKATMPNEDRAELRELRGVLEEATEEAIRALPCTSLRADLWRNAIFEVFFAHLAGADLPVAVLFPDVVDPDGTSVEAWAQGLESAAVSAEVAHGCELDVPLLLSNFRFRFLEVLADRASRPSSHLGPRFSVLYGQLADSAHQQLADLALRQEAMLGEILARLNDLVDAVPRADEDEPEVDPSSHGGLATPLATGRSVVSVGDQGIASYLMPRLLLTSRDVVVPITPEQAVFAFEHFALVGDPGSGKSALLNEMAAACRARRQGLAYLFGRTPLYLSLRQLRDGAEANVDGWLPTEALHAASTGQLLTLLDGLDEVEPVHRPVVEEAIRRLVDDLPPGNRLVVATRHVGSGLSKLSLLRLELPPLNDRERSALIDAFLGSESARFQHALQHLDDIRSPLLLRILTNVFKETNQLPATTGELLRRFADIQIEGTLRRHSMASLSGALVRDALRTLAEMGGARLVDLARNMDLSEEATAGILAMLGEAGLTVVDGPLHRIALFGLEQALREMGSN